MNPLFLLFRPGMIAALLLTAVSFAQAKSAEDYFRGASYHYVAGKIQEASVEAEEGLRANPGDPRLQALAEHLRKMKDEQRGGSGQDKRQDNQQQNKENQKDRNDNDSAENKKDDKGDGKGDRQNNDRDNAGNGNKPEENRDEKRDGEGERPQPRQMSEEEAKRLLNSFADDEKKEQAERRKVIRARAGTEQDW